MKTQLLDMFGETLQRLSLPEQEVIITRPENPEHGEYTTNIAFLIGKELHTNPREVAETIVSFLNDRKKDSGEAQTHELETNPFTILQDIESFEIAGPGFINIHLTPNKISGLISEVITDNSQPTTHLSAEVQRSRTKEDHPQRIVVEFTDPNPFKELHVGHLYSNAVGESISRLLESQKNEVRRVCYQGDVGLHVAKALWGMIKKLSVVSSQLSVNATNNQQPTTDNQPSSSNSVWEEQLKHMETWSLQEKAKWLGEAYTLGANAYEDDEQAKKDIMTLNIYGFMAAQHLHVEESGWKPTIKYETLLTNQSGAQTPLLVWSGSTLRVEDIFVLYKTGRRWSLEYFDTQYHRLGTYFQQYYFESLVAELGYDLVKRNISNGIFEESEGAVVYRGEKKGLHTRVFINKLGLPTYEAKDLGLAPTKYKDWPYDKSIIITAKEVDEYFKVLLTALSDIKPDLATKTLHMSHGVVRLPEGKMSSRKGNVLTAEMLLSDIKDVLREVIEKNTTDYSADEVADILEKATIAAIKYSLLKVSLPSDISFDIKKSVSLDGDSGPYLLYTYARGRSVLRKDPRFKLQDASETKMTTPESWNLNLASLSFNPEEHALARKIIYFAEIAEESAESLAPSTMCHYLIDLAQAFNLFYAKHKIIEDGTVNESRILLTEASTHVLKAGLHLLGIETVERM